MRILFVWTGVTSYMADCWRALQRMPGVELKVVVELVESGKEFDRKKVLESLDTCLVGEGGQVSGNRFQVPGSRVQVAGNGLQEVGTFLGGWKPEVMFAVGWHSKVVRGLVTRKDWTDVPKVCCFDLPWRWKMRCLAARFVLGPFLRHYCAAYVPGVACARYAKWLGFRTIQRGLFSIDQERFERGTDGLKASEDQRETRCGFMYVGRMSCEKRVDLIEAAYKRYRELGGTWTLDYYGGKNFKGPEEMPRLYAEHACLVLASEFDPWPLVALEAKASGCEVIMSDRCGNRLEFDAVVVSYGKVEAMAEAMLRVERGERHPMSRERLREWNCEAWVKRTLEFSRELRGGTIG